MTSRVEFANALRGLAALAVIAAHYIGGFWQDRVGTLAPLRLPPISDSVQTPAVSEWLFPNIPFNWGVCAVGLFFLVSGFVIPFSLQRCSRAGFVAARAARILPVYGISFLIGAASLATLFAVLGEAFPFSGQHVALHAIAGMRAIVPFDRIDGVVWTLEMEIRFYAVCALAAGAIARGRLSVFAIPLALFAACVVMALAPWPEATGAGARIAWKALTVAALNGPFLIFMFIGVALNFYFRGHLSRDALAAVIAGLMVLFVSGAAITPGPLNAVSLVSYTVALAIFLLAFRFDGAWATARPLQFFSAISYPLYAVHAMLGYVILWSLTTLGVPPEGGVAVALGVVVLLGWGLHHAVERPSQALAGWLAHALSRKPSAIRAVLPTAAAPLEGEPRPAA